jgi:LPS-assembly protein
MGWPLLFLLVTQLDAPKEIELKAERLVYAQDSGYVLAEGQVVVRGQGAVITADRLVYDKPNHVATATGHVVGRLAGQGLWTVWADVVTFKVENDAVTEVFVLDGEVLAKEGLTEAQLFDAQDAATLRALGKNTLRLKANHFVREPDGWRVEDISLTPCDCDVSKPTWSIDAQASHIDWDNKRASLVSPTVRFFGVPVLWLPWLSIPLSPRASGLLFPKVGFTALSGFAYEQPVFVTLGRSADLTVTPGYVVGSLGPYGIRGPRLGLEFRYTPAAQTAGQLNMNLLYDVRKGRDAFDATREAQSIRGLRGDAAWVHRQQLGEHFNFLTDVRAHSDGYWQRDTTTDVVARENGALKSTVSLGFRSDALLGSVSATAFQDLRYGFDLFGRTPRLEGSLAPAFAPAVIGKLPSLNLWVPTFRLTPFATVSADFEVARFAAPFGPGGDEGVAANGGQVTDEAGQVLTSECLRERLYWIGATACGTLDKRGQGDGIFQRGERENRLRLNVFPKLLLAAQPLRLFSVSAELGVRANAWRGESSGTASARLYPWATSKLESDWHGPLWGQVMHHLVPMLETRWVPRVWGGAVGPYDAVDAAVDGRQHLQSTVEVQQRLTNKTPQGEQTWLRLDIGQGLDWLQPQVLAESYARATAVVGWVSVQGSLRGELVKRRLTRATLGLRVDDRRGDELHVDYDNLLDDGTNVSRKPLDLLFGAPLSDAATSRAQLLRVGASSTLKAWRIGYESVWQSLPDTVTLLQHTLSVGYTPNCNCVRVDLALTQRRDLLGGYRQFDVLPTLNISGFGNVGVAR